MHFVYRDALKGGPVSLVNPCITWLSHLKGGQCLLANIDLTSVFCSFLIVCTLWLHKIPDISDYFKMEWPNSHKMSTKLRPRPQDLFMTSTLGERTSGDGRADGRTRTKGAPQSFCFNNIRDFSGFLETYHADVHVRFGGTATAVPISYSRIHFA